MGSTKIRKGRGKILFHVGKELPVDGADFLLVPGNQNARGTMGNYAYNLEGIIYRLKNG